MPLSQLTRLRAAIIVIGFALTLFCLDASHQAMVGAAALFVLPVLIWLLVSNAVKEAPPFDDKAFHRTRPVTAGQVFRHLAGFHLLVLAGLLAVVLAYTWHFNLGGRAILAGVLIIAVAWIAIVSQFGIVASLLSSPKHWKGWGAVAVMLIPAILLFWYCVSFSKHFGWPSLVGLPLAAAVLYPPVWWLVAAKRRWVLGTVLGLVIGAAIPWISLLVRVPHSWTYGNYPWRKPELSIRRLKQPAEVAGMVADQATVSRGLEVRGLEPDEFIYVSNVGIVCPPSASDCMGTSFESDRVLSEMGSTGFSADPQGRLIPATASLFRAMGEEVPPLGKIPVWPQVVNTDSYLQRYLGLPVRSLNDFNKDRQPLSPATATRTWGISGATFRWVKVLDVRAKDGGSAKLPGTGVIRVLPLEENSSDSAIIVRVIEDCFHWRLIGHDIPAVMVRDSGGRPRFISLNSRLPARKGFLIFERDHEFRQSNSSPIRMQDALRDASLEVYWPEQRGAFEAKLPPPE